MKKLTMQDIARLAGVSKATVSRTIHSPQLVNPETREHIQQIMAEHHYVYNVHAADFSRRRTAMIGLIIPTVRSSIHAEVIHGIQQKLQETNLVLIIGHTEYNLNMELKFLNLFHQRRLAGIILTGLKPQSTDRVKTIVKSGVPCVITWETVDDDQISYVGFDNFKAAFSITQYLVSLGHTRIGLIMGPFQKAERVKQRFNGYKAVFEKSGIAFDPELAIEKEPTLVDGKEAMSRLLSLTNRPTAIFAASDVLAMGALTAIREKGLRVPEDISLAGFDDIDFAAYCEPPLTTVKVPAFEMGQLAVRVLLEMAQNSSDYVCQYCLDTQLIIRDSCGPPKT